MVADGQWWHRHDVTGPKVSLLSVFIKVLFLGTEGQDGLLPYSADLSDGIRGANTHLLPTHRAEAIHQSATLCLSLRTSCFQNFGTAN